MGIPMANSRESIIIQQENKKKIVSETGRKIWLLKEGLLSVI